MAFGEILLAGCSGQSRAGKMALSCPLGQPITARDLVHLARSRSQHYNKPQYCIQKNMDSSTIHEEDNLSRQKSEQKKSPRLTSSSKPFKKSFFLVATLWRFSWLCKTCNSSYLDYQFTSTTEPVAKHLVPRTFTLAYMEREVLYY